MLNTAWLLIISIKIKINTFATRKFTMQAASTLPAHSDTTTLLVPRAELLPVSAASPSMDHEHGTVCQPILEHQIRLSAPSSVISRPTSLFQQ